MSDSLAVFAAGNKNHTKRIDLQQFCYQKRDPFNTSSSNNNNNESDNKNTTSNTHSSDSNSKACDMTSRTLKQERIERVPGKRRIHVMADSDSDGCTAADPNEYSSKRSKSDLTSESKESIFLALGQKVTGYDVMDMEKSLVKTNWQVDDALQYLKKYCLPKSSQHKSKVHQHKEKHVKANGNNCEGQEEGDDSDAPEDQDELELYRKKVYDSDDSDEFSAVGRNVDEMSEQHRKIFDFMNTDSIVELQTVKNLSEKKASLITELRPFQNWYDLRNKLNTSKALSAELLNHAQELLNKQNNVANILAKCNKLVKRVESAIEEGAGIVEQPRLLNGELKLADYQLIGLNWLTVMHKQQMNGILADEMGLGKTIQIIAFLAYLKEKRLSKAAHLIVVPSSTLDNWAHELALWCPSLVVERYHGNQDERKRMRIRFAREGFTGFDVLLTTYHVVASTPEERKMFRVSKLHYVIFDEAHMLKNMTTQRYSYLFNINAEMRILLTGTPLQNNLLELMSLLCFVMPNFLGKNIEDIKSLFSKKSKSENGKDDLTQFQETQITRAKRIMKPFVLRRLKKDVLNNLPKKSTFIKKVPMSEKQHQYYNNLVEFYSNNKGEVCCGDRAGISIMMEMRKLANHPLLARYYFDDDKLQQIAKRLAKVSSYKKTNAEYIFEDLAVMSDFQVWQLCQKHEFNDVTIPDELICDSGKFQCLDKLLPELKAKGHRVLVFSQFTMILDILEKYLEIRNHGYCRLDGSTAVEERQDLINYFNSDSQIFVFLLSTRAGGVGINLTAADVCILHDIDFNPYNDKQAEDRCHRMGQKKPVSIYRLISESSIEEGMLLVAEEKLKLEQDITSNEKDEVQETKCVVRLLTMALGLDKIEEEQLNRSINNSITSPSK